MFGHYLPNKNEDATIDPKSKFHELNRVFESYFSILVVGLQNHDLYMLGVRDTVRVVLLQ